MSYFCKLHELCMLYELCELYVSNQLYELRKLYEYFMDHLKSVEIASNIIFSYLKILNCFC